MTTDDVLAAPVRVVAHAGWSEIVMIDGRKRNPLGSRMVDALTTAMDEAIARGEVACLISAEGPVFSAGADLRESLDGSAASERLVEYLESVDLLVVAKVSGGVFGAAVSVLAECPIVLMDPSARLALPEAQLGFYPRGVVDRLRGLFPAGRLLAASLTGDPLTVGEAVAGGLVSRALAGDVLDREAEALMDLVTGRPGVARGAREHHVAMRDALRGHPASS